MEWSSRIQIMETPSAPNAINIDDSHTPILPNAQPLCSSSEFDCDVENFQRDLRNIDVNSITPSDLDVQLDDAVVLHAGPLAKRLVQMGKLSDTYKKIAKWPSFSASQKKKFITVWKTLDGSSNISYLS